MRYSTNKNKGCLIGEVSRITGVSKDTLHFYERCGLLRPDTIGENGYRYYSRRNLWQLDVIRLCRSLDVPMGKIREILASDDNARVTELLMQYREEAMRRAEYYSRAAGDILWYGEQAEQLKNRDFPSGVELCTLAAEPVLAGEAAEDDSYHAALQESISAERPYTDTIRRSYGYVLDIESFASGEMRKQREYLRLDANAQAHISGERRFTLLAGEYAVFYAHVVNERFDPAPVLRWLAENGYTYDACYADEVGLQLFVYTDYWCKMRLRLKKAK